MASWTDELPSALNDSADLFCLDGRTITRCNDPVKISNRPGRGAVVCDEARNQMQMQMLCALTEGNGINPITTGQFLNKTTGISNG